MARREKKRSLTFKIVVGMIAGLVVGLVLNWMGDEGWIRNTFSDGIFLVGGKAFMAGLKMLVVPLVLVSLVVGTASLDQVHKLGRIGGKTLGLYLMTTAIAITVAILGALMIQPGNGFNLKTDATFSAKEAPPLAETIINIVPTNPVQAMTEGRMLQIIFFAILLGVAIAISGRPGERVGQVFKDMNEVLMKLIMMLMVVAPFGVFCLIARVFAQQGFSAIEPLAKYFFVVLGVLAVHAFIVYPTLLKLLSGLNPIQFFKKFREAPVFAFSTSSSNATIPVTLNVVEKKIGVNRSIASFTVPLGATINMDGTAIMQGVATIFIAQAYGISLGVPEFLMVILTATLASIGTAGVPGVGLIMLAMVVRQVGLPIEGIGLILGVDRLLDMARTAVNITGDGMVAAIVSKSERQFSMERFRAQH